VQERRFPSTDHPARDWRATLLLAVAVLTIVAAGVVPPIAQPPHLMLYADDRAWLGVPNAGNVLSNLPFVVLGLLGLLRSVAASDRGPVRELIDAYRVFCIGAIGVAVGSCLYHLSPTNDTLVWDRLPMAVSFMSLLAIVIGHHIDARLARKLMPVLIAAGIASVAYWAMTESMGRGDLRPYLLVQFLPLVLIPMILVLYRSNLGTRRALWWALAAYVVAKLFEVLDPELYAWTGFVSGHTLKHLVAAAGMAMILSPLWTHATPQRSRPL